MAKELAKEIVSAARGMPAVEMVVLGYSYSKHHGSYPVYGTDKEHHHDGGGGHDALLFWNVVDAHNYIVRQGFGRVLMGAELKFWEHIFKFGHSTSDKIIAIYAKIPKSK